MSARVLPSRRGADLVGRADLHYHPLPDEDAPYEPELVLEQLAAADLDVVAITEHDRVDLAQDLAERAGRIGLRTELIVGCEVTTAGGHLVALFVDRPPAPGRGVIETVAEIHDLGGLAIAAHPLLPTCVSFGALRASLLGPAAGRFDAIEVANPQAAAVPLQSALARRLARHHRVAGVGGSDAHGGEPGGAITHFAGHSAAELRASIEQNLTALSYQRISRLRFALAGPRYILRALRRRAVVRGS